MSTAQFSTAPEAPPTDAKDPYPATNMALPQNIDRTTFLTHLRQSGLLTDEQLAGVQNKLPDSNRGRVVARVLVELGLLTKFQAERLLIGRTQGFLLGQYRILDQLGRGGMGRVFKAEHRAMNRIVALKVLAPNVLKTDRARELFSREVRAIGQLVHPNLVTAYDANEANGRAYLVLEYVDGPNLEQLVRSRGPLPYNQACDYMRQAAHGLQCAHNKGMVHRDLKPANILVQRKDNTHDLVKISDFGLARLQTPGVETSASYAGTILMKDNTVMGTPDYLSPEQARNMHKADIRSDLYSLGCTFYYLLTGQVLFPGGNAMDKLIRHSTEKPLLVTDLRPEVPKEITTIVMKLLEKRPEDRYQTPVELAAALEPYAVSGTIPWAPLSSPSIPLVDSLATPVGPNDSKVHSVIDEAASDEMSALVNTVSPDGEPTPANTSPASTRKKPRSLLALIVIMLLLGLFLLGGAVLGAMTIAAFFSLR
jgi:eukaryotic-like serine/threonine-protein kinase